LGYPFDHSEALVVVLVMARLRAGLKLGFGIELLPDVHLLGMAALEETDT
jgi:hypothetical protein